MDSARTKREAKDGLDTSDVAPRIGSTKLTAAISRSALTLAVLSTLLLVAARPAQAQSETVLYNFAVSPDGATPEGGLTSYGGNFYGATNAGGSFGYGTVFELSPNGSGGWNETVLYSFCSQPSCGDGANPTYSYVTFDGLGNLYGSTWGGGANGLGVVYELSRIGASWTENVLYNFNGGAGDGSDPGAGVIMDQAGNFYGTTYYGGSGNNGTVFELSPVPGGGWSEQVIDFVCVNYAGISMDSHGNIYGAGCNNLFELSPNGSGGWTQTVIHTFAGGTKDGSAPESTPIVDSAGNVYGTTTSGGAKGNGTVYKFSPVTTGKKKGTWTEKLLYSFAGGTKDGSDPFAGIVFDTAGNIYGTTESGGKDNDGTVYELVAPVGTGSYKEKILYVFTPTDGADPSDTLILDSGSLYGTTMQGGSNGWGVVFEVNPGAKATATALTSAPNPSTSGEQVTFTAVVTPAPPDGELVSFMDGATLLGTGPLTSGSATFATSALPVGMSQITAVYGGDSDFGGSTSKALKQTVKK
jgi:uncharacterized repeat protein (TIGR03803 family)